MAVLSAALSGCGSSTENNERSEAAAVDDEHATISYNQTEPENPLVPRQQDGVGGISVLSTLFTGAHRVRRQDRDATQRRRRVAESIKTSDSKTYTIKLKRGWTFHDGTAVNVEKASSTRGTTSPTPRIRCRARVTSRTSKDSTRGQQHDQNGQVAGYRARGEEAVGSEDRRRNTFVVTLSAPFSEFATQLGYAAFFPMPASFFADQGVRRASDRRRSVSVRLLRASIRWWRGSRASIRQ